MLQKQHNMVLIFCQRFCFVVFFVKKIQDTQERKEDDSCGEPFALQNRFFGRCCLSFPLQKKDTSAKASVWRHLFRYSERSEESMLGQDPTYGVYFAENLQSWIFGRSIFLTSLSDFVFAVSSKISYLRVRSHSLDSTLPKIRRMTFCFFDFTLPKIRCLGFCFSILLLMILAKYCINRFFGINPSEWRRIFSVILSGFSVEWSRAKRAELVSRRFSTERQRQSLKVKSRKSTARKSKTAKRSIYNCR